MSVVIDMAYYGDHRQVPFRIDVLSRGNVNTSVAHSTVHYLTEVVRRDVIQFIDGNYLKRDPTTAFHRHQKAYYELCGLPNSPVRMHQAIMTEDRSLTKRWLFDNAVRHSAFFLEYVKNKYGADLDTERAAIAKDLSFHRTFDSVLKRFGTGLAWVFTTDAMAKAGMRVLGEHGIRVPEEIAALTLDNSPRYYHLGLTACSHNWDLIGYLMAHALIGDFPAPKTSHGYIRVNCPVIERFTTPRR